MSLLNILVAAEEELLLSIPLFQDIPEESGDGKSFRWAEFWVVHSVIYFIWIEKWNKEEYKGAHGYTDWTGMQKRERLEDLAEEVLGKDMVMDL